MVSGRGPLQLSGGTKRLIRVHYSLRLYQQDDERGNEDGVYDARTARQRWGRIVNL